MKEKALAASDITLDTASRTALNDEFKSLRDQITKVVTNAEFNGGNMIKSTSADHHQGPGQRRRHLGDHRRGSGPVAGRRRADRGSARPRRSAR